MSISIKSKIAFTLVVLWGLLPSSAILATYSEEGVPLLESRPIRRSSPDSAPYNNVVQEGIFNDFFRWTIRIKHNVMEFAEDLDQVERFLRHASGSEKAFYSLCTVELCIPREFINAQKEYLETIRLKFLAEKNAPKVPCPIPVASASTSVSRKSSADSAESIDLEDMEEPGAPGSSVRHRKPSARSSATVGGSGSDSDEGEKG